MGDIPGFSEMEARDLMLRVVREGKRRVRRRRVAAMAGSIVMFGAGLGGAAGAGVFRTNHDLAVNVAGEPSLPAQCRAGGTPAPGEARVGAGVRFAQLPSGFAPVASGTRRSWVTGEVATPGGSPSTVTPRLQVSLSYSGSYNPDRPTTTLDIQGHPATLAVGTPLGKLSAGQVAITWSPEPQATITVSADGVAKAQVVTAARHVIYDPGVKAVSVGDLGPVMSRSDAIAVAEAQDANSNPQRTVTWLITGRELGQAEQAEGVGGSMITQMMQRDDPMWVIATFGSFPNRSETAYGNGPNGGVGHVDVAVIDGLNGAVIETTQSPDGTIPALYAGLADHSTLPPCPSPSPTEPGLQPAQPVTNPAATGLTTVTAAVTKRGVEGDSAALQLDAGSDKNLTSGDTAYLPGNQPLLIGRVTQYGKTWAEVQPYTETAMATTVRLDPAGDEAIAVGNGPGRPLNLYMVNHNVRLTVGQKIITAGPITTGTPGGLLVGTIQSVTPHPGDQSPTVTVTPAAPTDPTSVAVTQQNH